MNKVLTRLAVFFFGIPIVVTLICLPYCGHLTLQLLVCIVSLLSAHECYEMLKTKTELPPLWLMMIAAGIIPFLTATHSILITFFDLPFIHENIETSTFVFICSTVLVVGIEVFTSRSFESSLMKISASVFMLFYTGYLLTFVQRMANFHLLTSNGYEPFGIKFIVVFILMVFFCDSFAWLFGVLLGKNNKGFVKASPNKSLVGFFGGFVGSILAGVLCWYFIPGFSESGSIWKVVIMGFCVAVCSIVGDLAESVMKRSCGIKDSGRIIPGRGGVLDSIDSILLSAPIYYILTNLFYKVTVNSWIFSS